MNQSWVVLTCAPQSGLGAPERAVFIGPARLAAGVRGWGTAPALLEFDPDRVVAMFVDVLDGVRALGFHPARAHAGLGLGACLGLKQQCVALVIPDPGRLVDHHYARCLVCVL